MLLCSELYQEYSRYLIHRLHIGNNCGISLCIKMIKSKFHIGVLFFGNDRHLRNENFIPIYQIHGTFHLKIIQFVGDKTSQRRAICINVKSMASFDGTLYP